MNKGHGVDEQGNVGKKLFTDPDELKLVRFAVYAWRLGKTLINAGYSGYIQGVKTEAGDVTTLKKFKINFPHFFSIIEKAAEGIGKSFEQDFFK